MELINIAQKIGENLKTARQTAGFTQKEVAEKLQTKQTIYSRYETGKIELDYTKILFLCNLFKIEPNELFNI